MARKQRLKGTKKRPRLRSRRLNDEIYKNSCVALLLAVGHQPRVSPSYGYVYSETRAWMQKFMHARMKLDWNGLGPPAVQAWEMILKRIEQERPDGTQAEPG